MAKTPTQLQATITANFPDNTSAEITPALLRAQQNETVTSFNYGAYLTSNTTVESASANYCDTSAGAFSLTLPTSPALGDMIRIRDVSGTWSTINLSLLPGSNKIESVTGTFVCDTSDANFDLVWRGGSVGWGVQFGVSLIERKPATIVTGAFASTGGATFAAVGRYTAPAGVLAVTGTSAVAWVASLPTVAANWNPADKNAAVTLSGSNLIATLSSNTPDSGVRGTPGVTSGHKYFEVTFTALSVGSSNSGIGIANATAPLTSYVGEDSTNGVGFFADGWVQGPGFAQRFGFTYAVGDVIGIELQTTGTPFVAATKNGGSRTVFTALPSGVLYPMVSFFPVNDSVTANFGASPFFSTIPTGATPWNT